jgi:hypothetical protein
MNYVNRILKRLVLDIDRLSYNLIQIFILNRKHKNLKKVYKYVYNTSVQK